MGLKLKQQDYFVPFIAERTKTDSDGCITVEGYGFVNEEVPGQKWILPRAAMEAATDAYLEYPTVREMHTSNAAGITDVIWDDKGALLRAKIVDPVAIKKVQEGVYRGFSVGVRAKKVQGNKFVELDWVENSLVDRPADPGARIQLVRTTELDANEELEVEEVEEATEEPRVMVPNDDKEHDGEMKELGDDGDEDDKKGKKKKAADGDEDDKRGVTVGEVKVEIPNIEEIARAAVAEKLAEIQAAIVPAEETDLARTVTELTTRAEEAEQTLTRVQTELAETVERAVLAEKRVAELEKQPTAQRPVVFPEAVRKTVSDPLTGNHTEANTELEKLLEEKRAIEDTQAPTDPREMQLRYEKLTALNKRIAELTRLAQVS